MNAANTNVLLNRLSVIHSRSLPVYLTYAVPFIGANDGQVKEALDHIATDNLRMADRLGELLLANGADVDPGEFPMYFTGYHDLSCDFLLTKMIDRQQRDITVIEDCVSRLNLAPLAKATAEEALGEAKGHLDSLEELTASRV